MGCPRWWLSWYEAAADPRPLTYPPNAHIIGWWQTGETADGSQAILVALVEAPNEAGAWDAIEQDWPGPRKIRFIGYKDRAFIPNNRFPLSDWMEERIKIGQAI